MSRFTQQTSWARGEIEPRLTGRQDADFYPAAAKRLENFLPDSVAGVEVRAGFLAFRDVDETITLASGTVATLQKDKQNLISYVYRTSQVVIHVGVYSVGSGLNYISVQALRISLDKIDTGSPVDFSAATAVGNRWISEPVGSVTARDIYEIGFATAGPAAFVTHRLIPPLRVFPSSLSSANPVFNTETPQFFQELFGFVTPTSGGTLWKGSEESLFTEQLTAGDTIKFRNQLFTVASTGTDSETSYTTFTTDETWDGPSLTARVDKKDADPFGGNPSLVAFFQSRLVFARTDDKPTGIWLSRSNDPFTIVPSSVDEDSPINQELFAEGADEFVWMTGSDRLYMGSNLGEYTLGNPDENLSPIQMRFFRIGNNGGAKITPANVDSAITFVNRSRSQVLSVVFDFGRQGFNTSNLSLLAQHLTRDVVDMAFRPPVTNDRTPRLFILTANLELRAFAISESVQLAAWNRITYSPAFKVRAISATSEFLFALIERSSGKINLAVLRNE